MSYLRIFLHEAAVTGVATNRSTRSLAAIFLQSAPRCCSLGD